MHTASRPRDGAEWIGPKAAMRIQVMMMMMMMAMMLMILVTDGLFVPGTNLFT